MHLAPIEIYWALFDLEEREEQRYRFEQDENRRQTWYLLQPHLDKKDRFRLNKPQKLYHFYWEKNPLEEEVYFPTPDEWDKLQRGEQLSLN